jgi:cytochrome b involved in lipid metabolism
MGVLQSKTYISYCEVFNRIDNNEYLIIGNKKIYNIKELYDVHPPGNTMLTRKIKQKKDCTKDIKFHAQYAQKKLEKYLIGYVKKCDSNNCEICLSILKNT